METQLIKRNLCLYPLLTVFEVRESCRIDYKTFHNKYIRSESTETAANYSLLEGMLMILEH